VGNDAMANFVWRNDGHGRFEEVGLLAGLAYDVHGVGQGTMGVECADYDNDGRLDFQMTSYQRQWALLYRNRGGGFFSDATYASGAGTGSFHQVEWGNGLVDFDNDGDRDLFMACGHLQDNIASWDDTGRYEAPKLLLENDGRGKFADVSASAGDGLRTPYSSRGAAFDDLDGDGDIDVVVLNARREPTLLRNDTDTGHHWARIRLRGTRTNRDGVGARVLLSAGGRRLMDEVHSGRGYQSHFGSDLHFGLGSGARVDRLEVRWVGGGTNVWEGLAVDRTLVVREDGAVDVGQGSSRSPGAASGR